MKRNIILKILNWCLHNLNKSDLKNTKDYINYLIYDHKRGVEYESFIKNN